MHRDHLGSVALVTNDAGQVVSPASFDAFGKRRNSNWSDNATGSGLPDITGNIGFTGQETIKEIGLIHMNGRIYDPNLGRFLSADPLIQAPYNSQSYNRYSYVMNNPLSLVDPTGYSWVSKKWKKHGRKVVAKVAFGVFGHSKTVRSIMTAGSCILMPLSCGAAVATNAWVSGAKTSDALKAGARAQAAAYAGQVIAGGVGAATNNGAGGFVNYSLNVAGNGIAGGVASHINGGSFNNGFIASAVGASLKQLNGQLFNRADQTLQRVAFASIAGGAASYLSGGKVGHGMFSAAFTQYWNNERTLMIQNSSGYQQDVKGALNELVYGKHYNTSPSSCSAAWVAICSAIGYVFGDADSLSTNMDQAKQIAGDVGKSIDPLLSDSAKSAHQFLKYHFTTYEKINNIYKAAQILDACILDCELRAREAYRH